MKTVRFIIFSSIFTALFAVSAFAQTEAASKVALINTDAFYAETGGITKIANGYKSLETEFKADFTELENMAKKLQALQAEVQKLQTPNPQVPVKPETIQAKVDEGQKLQRDYKFKQEDVKARYEKREVAVMNPITQDIGKAISDFAKQKGYTMVMDSGKLVQAQVLLYLQETTDITKDFITFYNTRPAGTATTKP